MSYRREKAQHPVGFEPTTSFHEACALPLQLLPTSQIVKQQGQSGAKPNFIYLQDPNFSGLQSGIVEPKLSKLLMTNMSLAQIASSDLLSLKNFRPNFSRHTLFSILSTKGYWLWAWVALDSCLIFCLICFYSWVFELMPKPVSTQLKLALELRYKCIRCKMCSL